jgi:hypothetical protein
MAPAADVRNHSAHRSKLIPHRRDVACHVSVLVDFTLLVNISKILKSFGVSEKFPGAKQ